MDLVVQVVESMYVLSDNLVQHSLLFPHFTP
jgi:hypothetical protein